MANTWMTTLFNNKNSSKKTLDENPIEPKSVNKKRTVAASPAQMNCCIQELFFMLNTMGVS